MWSRLPNDLLHRIVSHGMSSRSNKIAISRTCKLFFLLCLEIMGQRLDDMRLRCNLWLRYGSTDILSRWTDPNTTMRQILTYMKLKNVTCRIFVTNFNRENAKLNPRICMDYKIGRLVSAMKENYQFMILVCKKQTKL